MAVNPRQKGASAETTVRDILRRATGLAFERTPASGALAYAKGDLWLPSQNDRFCIEVKHYAESHFNDKIFTSKTNNIVLWWTKIQLQAKQSNKEPLLIWKYNRSKIYVCTQIKPVNVEKYVDMRWLNCYTMLLDDWLGKEKIQWLK
jgi:Holliday junction resolvase